MELNPNTTDGAVVNIQLNRWGAQIQEIEGQTETFPLANRDYVLQLLVEVDYVTYNDKTKRFRYTVKPHGDFKLIAVQPSSIGRSDE